MSIGEWAFKIDIWAVSGIFGFIGAFCSRLFNISWFYLIEIKLDPEFIFFNRYWEFFTPRENSLLAISIGIAFIDEFWPDHFKIKIDSMLTYILAIIESVNIVFRNFEVFLILQNSLILNTGKLLLHIFEIDFFSKLAYH